MPQRRMTPAVVVMAAVWLTACGHPHIRIANRSDVPLENVRVRFPSQTENFGTLPPKTVTAYREIERAYSTAYIEATVGGQPAIFQPIDHVGDNLLGGGRYTYALTVNADARQPHDRLRVEFVRE